MFIPSFCSFALLFNIHSSSLATMASSKSKSPAPMSVSAAAPNRYHHTVTSLQASDPHIPRSLSASYFTPPTQQISRPISLYSYSQNRYFQVHPTTVVNNRASFMPVEHDDLLPEPPSPSVGHKRTVSNPSLRTRSLSSTSPLMSVGSTTVGSLSASFIASTQPDRYHRRRSVGPSNVVINNTASSSSSTTASHGSTSSSSSSSTFEPALSVSPSPTTASSSGSNGSATVDNTVSHNSQHPSIYKNPDHSQSTSAISSASSSTKKDYSSLSSVSYSSEGMYIFVMRSPLIPR